MGCAGGDNEVVVANFRIRKFHHAPLQIEADNFAQQNFYIFAPAQNPTDGRGYLAGRNSGSRNLIKKRLKGVMVLAVDQNDANRQFRQLASCFQATKSRANNHDTRFVIAHVRSPCAAGNYIRRYASERYIDSRMSNRTELFAATKGAELATKFQCSLGPQHSKPAGDQN